MGFPPWNFVTFVVDRVSTKKGNPLTAGSPRCMTLPRGRHACPIKTYQAMRGQPRAIRQWLLQPEGAASSTPQTAPGRN